MPRHVRDADDLPLTVPPADAPLPTEDEVRRWILAYLRHAPLSLTLREINRLVAFEIARRVPEGEGQVEVQGRARAISEWGDTVASNKGPILDVGCGDGFWWTLRDGANDVYGIDISAVEVQQAKARINAALTDVSRERPFPGTEFEEIIGNCSLEHVPDIDAALSNLRKAAAPNARLIMFVPTPKWALQGRLQALLLRRAPRIAMALSGALNGFFQHWHLYDAKVWTRLLAQHGWRVRATYGLGSARSEFLFRLFLPPGFVEFIGKKLTGVYPSRWIGRFLPDAMLAPAAKLVQWAVSDPLVPVDSPTAYEYLIIADAAEVPA